MAEFKPGETGVGKIRYGFHKVPDVNVQKETERIKKGNAHLPRHTVWESSNESKRLVTMNEIKKARKERRYKKFAKLRKAGYTLNEISDELGLAVQTLRNANYEGRYKKENA